MSLKHLYPWKYGEKLCLWGNRRTKDDEERCYGGYSDKLDRAELYSIDEFLKGYGYCTKKDPISSLLPGTLKELKKSFDCVFLPKDVAERYYKDCGFVTDIALDEKTKNEIEALRFENKQKDQVIENLSMQIEALRNKEI